MGGNRGASLCKHHMNCGTGFDVCGEARRKLVRDARGGWSGRIHLFEKFEMTLLVGSKTAGCSAPPPDTGRLQPNRSTTYNQPYNLPTSGGVKCRSILNNNDLLSILYSRHGLLKYGTLLTERYLRNVTSC
jgi:hypothetical protein